MLIACLLWLVGFVLSLFGVIANGVTSALLAIPSVTLAVVAMYQRVYVLTNASIAGALLGVMTLFVAASAPILVARAVVGIVRLIRGVR